MVMPVPVVAIRVYVPAVPVLRSMLKVAMPPALSIQSSVSWAALAAPTVKTALPTSIAPKIFHTIRLDTLRDKTRRDRFTSYVGEEPACLRGVSQFAYVVGSTASQPILPLA